MPTPVDALECDRVGTELDWLRFWWAFRHSAISAALTLLEILDDITGQAVS